MSQESVVYGCIKGGSGHTIEAVTERNQINQSVLSRLPVLDEWPYLTCDMFSTTPQQSHLQNPANNIIHFAGSYIGVEYEWNLWMQKFEALLKSMVWQSAVVHLDTELSGLHTFIWETNDSLYTPDQGSFNVRCEWSHELAS